MDTTWLLQLGALGALTGFTSALLGMSGGFVLVPALYWLLPRDGVAASMVPLVAAASSLAAMVPVSASGALAQRRLQRVETGWLKRLAPGLVAGSAGGALLASQASAPALSLVFLAYALWFATRLRVAPATAPALPPAWPTNHGAWGVGGLIGTVSAVVGGGGTTMTVAYLMQRDVAVHRAIGTGPAVGLLLGVSASAAFAALAAVGAVAQLPAAAGLHLLGLVHWPTVLVAGGCGTLAAPYGARLAARLPARQLRSGFAIVTVGIALAMLARTLVP